MTDINNWFISIQGDLKIYVPKDINDFTTYALLEQEDWFEPEIHFVREFTESGMTAMDMDAGYGVYALAMAKEMEGKGRVIARNANEYFTSSVEQNHLQDRISTELGASSVDFIRLGNSEPDSDLLDKGHPLVMFPASAENINFFQNQGFKIYRHVPGLNILVPYTEDQTPANLFACRQERADELEDNDLLVRSATQEISPHLNWQEVMGIWPYAQEPLPQWKHITVEPGYENALNAFLSSLVQEISPDERYALLIQSLNSITDLRENKDVYFPATLAKIRIRSDLGQRQEAAALAKKLLDDIGQGVQINLDMPFLSPNPFFDQKPIVSNLGKWLAAAIIYSQETQQAYTSFHHTEENLPLLTQGNNLLDTPLEIQRRLALCAMRLGMDVNIHEESRLLGDECLNAKIWKELAGLNQVSKSQQLTIPQLTASPLDTDRAKQVVQIGEKPYDPEKIIQESEQVLANDPDNIAAFYLLTQALLASDRIQEGDHLLPLNEALETKGWSYKKPLYNYWFEKVEVLREVQNPQVSVVVISNKFKQDTVENFKRLNGQCQGIGEIILVNNGCPTPVHTWPAIWELLSARARSLCLWTMTASLRTTSCRPTLISTTKAI